MNNTLDFIRDRWDLDLSAKSPIEIPNTNREVSLTRLFRDLNFKVGAEIGVERGLFSQSLCEENKGLKLYCVDPWMAYRGYREHTTQSKLDGFYEETQERLAPYDCHLIRKTSTEAAADFENRSLDFIYVDGNHSLLHVVQDLCHWVPKVRAGGIIAGHDYIERTGKGYLMHVIPAVNAYVKSYGISPWFVFGRKEIVAGELRDKPRSFLWVKQGSYMI